MHENATRRAAAVTVGFALAPLFTGAPAAEEHTGSAAQAAARSGIEQPVTFRIIERRPPEAEQLGFAPGARLAIGFEAPLTALDGRSIEVADASATNGTTTFELIGFDFPFGTFWETDFGATQPAVENLTGAWTYTACDASGNSYAFAGDPVEDGAVLPYVSEVRAELRNEGDLMVTWKDAELSTDQQELCTTVVYKIRLLRSVEDNPYKSEEIADTSTVIPAATIAGLPGGLDGMWLSVEQQCQTDAPRVGFPLEATSSTFDRLADLLDEGEV